MRDLPGQILVSRNLKVLAVFATCIMLSGCYSCSLNGGWEGQMNPFCVEKNALIGPIALPNSAATPLHDEERPTRSSRLALVEPRGVELPVAGGRNSSAPPRHH